MFKRKVVPGGSAIDQLKSESLPANVNTKIEEVFGLDKDFTHWGFEDLLPENNKSKERARIPVMLKGWTFNGCIKVVGKDSSRKGNPSNVYRAQRFPLNFSRKNEGEPPSVNVDSIFFNLGKRAHEQINLQCIGRASSRPRKADTGGEKKAPTNQDVYSPRPD